MINDKVINHPTIKKFLVIFGAVLYPLLYWLDLTGPDDTPSNSKIMYFLALVVSLFALVLFGVYYRSNGGLNTGFILYALLVLSFAGGHDLFKTVIKNKAFFSSIDKITDKETKEIEQRRQQGGDQGVEVTE